MRSTIGIGTLASVFALTGPALVLAQYGDIGDLEVARPSDRIDVQSAPPPEGAIVLFDGSGLDEWVQVDGLTPSWEIVDGGAMQAPARGGEFGIKTRRQFDGPYRLHVEFRVPYMPDESGQARGNSGVYNQGRYEVQILDSYGIDEPGSNDCGAIYEVSPPRVNACKAPTVWQGYDIDFRPPVFRDGAKVEPARVTVHQNGILIQDDVPIPVDNTRAGLGGDPSTPGPLHLQDHTDPVQYRNIWLLPKGE
ncbi:3-keto-disaccharide hydrolase [Tautonia plasticadhaerens]|uniref:3-keto-alpha-glucoside-1,2-lyase/3-keto-2-hydroxy-glucal hydratase domain-containing protein n=1 Tax=Tautonia plasticadhaerens TaxID=2527974 RepID=A0A518H577_9BACT|nr:DUF1080 domain-containing protein [Tautonia plasticadhaerens]QDV35991.1 hypothetical protein ElP_39010 [Tautonia plasticadhaerens]